MAGVLGDRSPAQPVAGRGIGMQLGVGAGVARRGQMCNERREDFADPGRAVGGRLAEQVPHEFVQVLRDPDVDVADPRRKVFEVLRVLVPVRSVLERLLAGEQLEQHGAERVEVHRGGDVLPAAELLRRHVTGAARRGAQRGVARGVGVGQVGDAEVEQLHRPVRGGDHHVAGLEVPVHHAVRMGVAEGIGDLDGDRDGRAEGERAAQVKEFTQADPVDVLHHEVRLLVVVTAVQQARDGGMVKLFKDRPLALEPLHQLHPAPHPFGRAEPALSVGVEAQHLDRDQPSGGSLRRRPDASHAALIERFLDPEATVEDFPGFHPYPRFTAAPCQAQDSGSQHKQRPSLDLVHRHAFP